MNIGRFEIDKIYNEDCYKAIKDIPDKSIDCIYTDVPYLYEGNANSNASRVASSITKLYNNLNDNNLYNDGINYDILKDFVRVCKKINIFIWCSKMQLYPVLKWFQENTDSTFQILTWNKTNPTPMCNGNWLPDIEYCLYFNRGAKLNDGYEFKSKWYLSAKNKKDKDKFEHPTIKPLPLVERHLKHTTQEGDLVLDTFIGSGTTAVACKNICRHYIGFEINKHWYDVANDRLNNIDSSGQISLFTI